MKFDLKKLPKQIKAFWKEPPKGRFLNLKEIFCLGSAGLGVSFICNIVNMYVTIGYLPTLYNLGPSGSLHATVIYIISCAFGLLFTPLYGRMVQRTKSKFGRYKPYILFLAPIVCLAACLACWSPQSLSLTGRTIYVYLTAVPTLFIWNLWYNTFNMFPGVFTPNQQERTDIWAPIGLVMGFAPSLMNVLKDVFAGIWGDVIAARIFGITSAVVGVICIVGLIKVKERVFITEIEDKKEKVTTWQGLKMVFKNKPLMILTIALILGSLKGTIDIVWHIVARVKYSGNMATGAQIFGALSLVIGFAATPNMILLPWLTRKFNNRSIMIFWQALNTAGYLIFALVGFQNLPVGSTSVIVISILRFMCAFNALGSLQPLILSEIGDHQQNMCGYRLEGFVQTFAYSLVLLFTQCFALVPAIIQMKMGFNLNDYIITNTPNVDPGKDPLNILSQDKIDIANKYFNIAVWISLASAAAMLVCLCFYNLSKKKHAQIMEELKAKSVNSDEIESEAGEGLDVLVEEMEKLEAEKIMAIENGVTLDEKNQVADKDDKDDKNDKDELDL